MTDDEVFDAESTAWDPTLETGDPIVDRQHRTIHELFDELVHAEDSRGEILRVLERLSEHTLMHFSTEEELMRRVDYPADAAATHKAEHMALTQATREKILQFRSGELTSTGPLIVFLREWLAVHVHECDRELIDYVRERDVVAEVPPEWSTSRSVSSISDDR